MAIEAGWQGAPCRPPVTRSRLLAEALRIVDEEGLENLSMRKLGRACGIEAMSVYHHVPDKAAILDGIHEAVYAHIELPELPAGTPWDEELAAVLRAVRDAFLRHPGALPVVATRGATSVAHHRVVDRIARILLDAGFRPLDVLYAGNALGVFVTGFALAAAGRSPREPEGLTNDQWRTRLASVADSCPSYLELMRALPGQGFDWDDMFEVGLRAMLDGLRTRIAPPSR